VKKTLHKVSLAQEMAVRALHFERLLGACLLVGFLRAQSDPNPSNTKSWACRAKQRVSEPLKVYEVIWDRYAHLFRGRSGSLCGGAEIS